MQNRTHTQKGMSKPEANNATRKNNIVHTLFLTHIPHAKSHAKTTHTS